MIDQLSGEEVEKKKCLRDGRLAGCLGVLRSQVAGLALLVLVCFSGLYSIRC